MGIMECNSVRHQTGAAVLYAWGTLMACREVRHLQTQPPFTTCLYKDITPPNILLSLQPLEHNDIATLLYIEAYCAGGMQQPVQPGRVAMGAPQMAPPAAANDTTGGRLSTQDALTYLRDVKQRFQQNRQV
jgi:hypothetical protein